MFQKILRKYMQPIIKDAQEEAYKKGAEDTIRRFAFVYDAIAQKAKEEAWAEAGAIPIEEIDEELSQTVFEGLE